MKYCNECKIEKIDSEFSKNRCVCKLCRNKYHKKIIEIRKSEDIILYTCKRMAYDAHSRIFAKSRDYKKCYKDLKEPFGFENANQLKYYLYDNFGVRIKWYLDRGITPSIDRVDSKYGYTKYNIRIISFKRNTDGGVQSRRRKVEMIDPSGNVYKFDSVIKCANYFGIFESKNANKISSWIRVDGKYKPPTGFKFKYL